MANNKIKTVIKEWVDAIIIAGILAIFVRTFFFQIYKIPSNSMVPTLIPGDKIFVSKLIYGPKMLFTDLRIPGLRKPKMGEVIVFVPPHEKKNNWFQRKQYIKRLIGAGGDRILVKDGNIYINGKMIVEPSVTHQYYYNCECDYGEANKEITVPPNHYFFLGDNSMQSSDSRYWGFVDEKDIVGKAIFIWWPLKRIGIIE